MSALSINDFAAFFREVHGVDPFPWQVRLAHQVIRGVGWPRVLDLPTGCGKTAAIDVAVFHLAVEAELIKERRAPVRITYVVDRRLVVDEAYERARRIAARLEAAEAESTCGRVAAALKTLSLDGPPLLVGRLRGGVPLENDWARTPSQPTVLCSTVDQIGSRLLFRGYGVSDSMKPVHAGLLGSDCLILVDEAHVAEPFRQTLDAIGVFQGEKWRGKANLPARWVATLLTATPGENERASFSLEEADHEHPILARRLSATKPVRLVVASAHPDRGRAKRSNQGLPDLISSLVEEARDAMSTLASSGIAEPAVAVVVNRIRTARIVFERLKDTSVGGKGLELVLMIGPARPIDRERLSDALAPLRTRLLPAGEMRQLDRPVIVVATQCIEVGVDLDFDGLVSELAPIDSLRQRFGRLNRSGRNIRPYGAVIASRNMLRAQYDDPIYGRTLAAAWEYLGGIAARAAGHEIVDFGLNAMRAAMERIPVPAAALSPRADAPVLMPAVVDLLAQTSPIPRPDPDTSLFLRGPKREPDAVTVAWRGDIDPRIHSDNDLRRLLLLLPPRSAECIELPVSLLRQWLQGSDPSEALGDVSAMRLDDESTQELRSGDTHPPVFRWKGDDDRSQWVKPGQIMPGDTVIIPAAYGGLDQFGWNPEPRQSGHTPSSVEDVAERAAQPFAARRFVVRIAEGLLDDSGSTSGLEDALASAESRRWEDLRGAVLKLQLPPATRDSLLALDHARGGRHAVQVHHDLYGYDEDGRPRGLVFVAPQGLKKPAPADALVPATENDSMGSFGAPLLLVNHSKAVAAKARAFAQLAGLPDELVDDLEISGALHDAGKADSRFQRWLHHGDPLGPDDGQPIEFLAKSTRRIPTGFRASVDLPDKWRHEALSVRLAIVSKLLRRANDPDLVLWLIGVHHGYGRPFFPHADPFDEVERTVPSMLELPSTLPAGAGPQALAFDWNGFDWAALFERLRARYGVWGLAHLEAILRLADHRASEEASDESGQLEAAL